jgi:hypothetical protein
MELNHTEVVLAKLGWVRCPNHAQRWYASRPGILEPVYRFTSIEGCEVTARADTLVYGDRIDVTARCQPTMVIRSYSRVEDFLSSLAHEGEPAEPGLPAFSNSWD